MPEETNAAVAALEADQEDGAGEKPKRASSKAKAFPIMPLEETLWLAKAIADHGFDDQIRRVTLFADKLQRSPDSGTARGAITASARYGVTDGSYKADQLKLRAPGKKLVDPTTGDAERRKTAFDVGVAAFEPFLALYTRLKDKRLPADEVMRDLLREVGIAEGDRESAGRVFLKNVEFAGLVKESTVGKRVIPVEQMVEESGSAPPPPPPPRSPRAAPVLEVARPGGGPMIPDVSTAGQTPVHLQRPTPTVHLDFNIHIDANATTEQIDKLFASMAKHFGMGPAGGASER